MTDEIVLRRNDQSNPITGIATMVATGGEADFQCLLLVSLFGLLVSAMLLKILPIETVASVLAVIE
jgi:hypothetical protein